MQIQIGEKIKKLRAGMRMTQETLATRLGVTPQAVSRWESQTGYPDIELLPSLAACFGVTTDELLGVDQKQREEKLEEIYAAIHAANELGTGVEAIPPARQWAAEFPADDRIQKHLADSLCRVHMWSEERDMDALREARVIYELLIDSGSALRDEALEALATLYDYGYDDAASARETAMHLPSMKYCRESVLASLRNSEESKQDYIERLTDSLGSALTGYIIDGIPNDRERWDDKIVMLDQVIALYRLVFGENQLFYHGRTAYVHRIIATYLVAQGKHDETLARLEIMCEHIEACVRAKPGDRYTSPFMDRLVYPEPSEDFDDLTVHNAAWYVLHNKLTQSRYDAIRSDARFAAILSRLAVIAE
ncbi:MAG: helix-turn-helix transcriptional regulator [Ruminococcaceae bacterium]|nr:helix-turn-helix transcriptional regulator [Oscillospiraceae bacterium]